MVAMCCIIYNIETKTVLLTEYDGKRDGVIESIHDYAIDKHTKLGRKMGKTRKDFVEVGANVEPEDPRFIDELLLTIYKDCDEY